MVSADMLGIELVYGSKQYGYSSSQKVFMVANASNRLFFKSGTVKYRTYANDGINGNNGNEKQNVLNFVEYL